jgi:hypothetical protein
MSERDNRPWAAPASALAILVLLTAAVALTTGVASADNRARAGVTAPPTAITLSANGQASPWTAERVAAARPLDLREGDRSVTSRRAGAVDGAEVFGNGPTTLRSSTVDHPERYPNRVHGKIVGTFRGLGDYSCSATVVSSGSGSLLTTAGHCLFDAGGTNRFATNLAFAPGTHNGQVPYGIWPVTNGITTRQWVRRGSLDYDVAMLRTQRSPSGSLQAAVGSRGIGFNQPRRQRLSAFGYPASGGRHYDGKHLIRCDSGYVPDPFKYGGPRGRGMHCDQKEGSSGGGWVAQHSFVVSNTSHGYPRLSRNLFFGPYYGSVAKSLYRADRPGWPSIGPVRCGGKVADIVATDRSDKIRGTGGPDVIATLGGGDVVKGRGGRDIICGGGGNDGIAGGGDKDAITGGAGSDRCGGREGPDRMEGCESKRGRGGR